MNRGFAATALVALVSMGCSSEVNVDLLPDAHPPTVRALRFAGPYDRVEVPSSPLLDVPQDFAFEAWLMVESYAGGHGVFNRWQRTIGDIQLTFGTPEPLPAAELPAQDRVPSHTLAAWGYVGGVRWITAFATSLPSLAQWHHLAVSYGAGELKLYVDGARWATAAGTETIANPAARLFIGATARTEQLFDPAQGDRFWPPIHGAIAEVRISSVDRYKTDFAPERMLVSDASTIALWHLDEGAGNVARDSGPSHLDGAIIDAAWSDLPPR